MHKEMYQRDKIETFHKALIQHGPLSRRIYLMKLKDTDADELIGAMETLAQEKGYTKIFAKAPAEEADIFLQSGYEKEAEIPNFFNGQETVCFLARFLDDARRREDNFAELERIKDLALSKKPADVDLSSIGQDVIIRQCRKTDARQMSRVYKAVFDSYPFPIDKPGYITDTMSNNFVYFGAEISGRLAALSSAEMDVEAQNAEMTDFATLDEFRGNGLAGILLRKMEDSMRERQIKTGYTIARAVSAGMNITFAKAGYKYGGRLKNNTNISGAIESMNIWHKQL